MSDDLMHEPDAAQAILEASSLLTSGALGGCFVVAPGFGRDLGARLLSQV